MIRYSAVFGYLLSLILNGVVVQYLFHAAAVFKHFQLTREMKRNISSDELAKMASRVLAAVLCVPLPSQVREL